MKEEQKKVTYDPELVREFSQHDLQKMHDDKGSAGFDVIHHGHGRFHASLVGQTQLVMVMQIMRVLVALGGFCELITKPFSLSNRVHARLALLNAAVTGRAQVAHGLRSSVVVNPKKEKKKRKKVWGKKKN